jgi:hypothetical protein
VTRSAAVYEVDEWMNVHLEIGLLNQPMVRVGIMLVLVVPGLCLGGMIDPVPAASAYASPPLQVGLGPTDTTGQTIWLPVISCPEVQESNVWQAEYYANMNLSGVPKYTQREVRIDYDWGDESGPWGLPDEQFSIRWTGLWDMEVGKYTFFVDSDDGVRLWLDDELLIDAWMWGVGTHQVSKEIQVEGPHQIVVEYFEGTGGASIRVHWRRTDLYPQWQGDYYNDPWVEGSRAFSQKAPAIQFDWEEDCPAGISDCDSFSIAWEARPLFEPGTHRIFIYADEGYQLLVDGTKVKEGGWNSGQGGGGEDASYVLHVTGTEHHTIAYNFHDQGGAAEARLWIENMEQPEWTVEYYDNTNLTGTPVKTDEGVYIFYDWDYGKPIGLLPSSDHFSIRWTGQRNFHAGFYRFGLFADDGVRLTVDGEVLVDEWHDGRSEYYSPFTYLSTGYHDVVVEYYEHTGEAEIRLWWE